MPKISPKLLKSPKKGSKTLKSTRVIQVIPNAITVTALCTGLSSIRFALLEQWQMAVTLIIIAAILDGIDGRVARLLRASSRFGAELDSLSDFIAFGVAPGVVLYLYALESWGGFGWAMTLMFSTAQALRLARFNSRMDLESESPEWTKSYGVGVPAPAGAIVAITPLMLSFALGVSFQGYPALIAPFMVGSALLMISRVPTFLLKNVRLSNRHARMVLVAIAVFMAVLFSSPWLILSLLSFAYLFSIPYSVHTYKTKKNHKPSFS